MNVLEILQQIITPVKVNKPKKKSSVKTRITKTSRILNIQWHQIPVQIISSSRTKRLRISHSPSHDIRISVPRSMSETMVSVFVRQHEDWIVQQYLSKSDSLLESNSDLCNHSRGHFEIHKESALLFCTHKVEQRNKDLWWKYNNITVKSLRSKRWSCSSKWNLNFNYKLMFLPEPMADYIIVHELCHLHEMNHGPRFWKLVDQVYGPEWKNWRKIR